jgi:hypothetical protein
MTACNSERLGDTPLLSRAFCAAWLLLLIIVAFYIRVCGADIYHPNFDEMMHIDIAEGNTLGEVLRFSLHEAHPPLGHILLHTWLTVAYWR